MSAILFGSIGTIADTSELQRESFNEAFAAHGLDWEWSQEEYAELLQGSGGAKRIADYAKARDEEVDAEAIHADKSARFQEKLKTAELAPRPGVVETISDSREAGFKVGLVTTTSGENVAALLDAVTPSLAREAFDIVVDLGDVGEAKPDPAAYTHTLEALGEDAGHCVAVEDNLGGVQSAKAGGLAVVAFPNTNTSGHDFDDATRRVDTLSFDELRGLIAA